MWIQVHVQFLYSENKQRMLRVGSPQQNTKCSDGYCKSYHTHTYGYNNQQGGELTSKHTIDLYIHVHIGRVEESMEYN